MERLTNKKEAAAQRQEYVNRLKNGYPRNIPEERFLKLAAYEDTGLTPEEIKALIPLPKDSLTLEELLEMDGEPVWVEIPTGRVAEWCISKFDPLMNRVRFWCSGGGWFDGRNVGKSLFVYRRRPEEGTT